MEKEKIREIVSQEIKHTRFRKSHPSRMMDLEESLVESLHQALSMSGVMPRSLSSENGAKALLLGEFHEDHIIRYYDSEGELVEYTEKVPVSWSTIKEIYAKIVSHYGA